MAKLKENPIAGFESRSIDLAKFNLLDEKSQYETVEKTLKEIYQDNLKLQKKHILKVIKLTLNPKDDYIMLPYGVKVVKEKLQLNFVESEKKIGIGLLLFGTILLILAVLGATYSGFRFLKLSSLNKDIDKDGIADINIDINNDLNADINVDLNNDDKPDMNIDYKGNRRIVFNIDVDNDGKADSNLVTKVTDKDGLKTCKLNCDINGDGWPDTNLDLDGDGKADIDIDNDFDSVPDINLDINGDGICDIMCDEDGDGECDSKCIKTVYNGLGTGSSSHTGDASSEAGSTMLIIRYVDGDTINVDNLVPDDQPLLPGETIVKPIKEFTIENLSKYSVEYNLKWQITYNTFITDHLKYKVIATNGGANIDYTTAPTTNAYIAQRVVIPPLSVQKYTIEFNLVGTHEQQNEDQSKSFKGLVIIET